MINLTAKRYNKNDDRRALDVSVWKYLHKNTGNSRDII